MSESPIPLKFADAVYAMLKAMGHEKHPETGNTPERVSVMWREKLLSGYASEPTETLNKRIRDDSGATIVLRAIPFHSMCPHHLVPYFGTVDLAYEPDGWIVGLGALEDLVASRSRRLVLQEELTGQLVADVENALSPKGVACRIEAQHLCLMLNGREPRSTWLETNRATGSLAHQWGISSNPGQSRRCDHE